ncbi:MarR family winged helix-turn-helix transcriptional regulator [Pseudarthrobacter oxydans]|uniref:MarR family winged helix-turn-helix transcriptional regulator n=1 Tax=Pseudarthrobacter oxydans TaxID=1671 RepID=UPI003803F1F6
MSESLQTAQTGPAAAAPGDFGWHLGMVLRGYQFLFEEAVEGMPAGIRGYQILSTVLHRDPPNQQALGAHLAIDRTVLTYLLDALVDAGVVERVPAPSDRRARKIVATDNGREILARYEERVASAESELLSGLKESEADTLAALIARLAMDVHRSQPGSSPCEAMDHLP